MRPGRSFGYRPGDEAQPLLLLAGGIGITPLFSILRHCCQLAGAAAATSEQEEQQPTAGQQGVQGEQQVPQGAAEQPSLRAMLLYSASVPQEFALLPDLRAMQRESAGGWSRAAEGRIMGNRRYAA